MKNINCGKAHFTTEIYAARLESRFCKNEGKCDGVVSRAFSNCSDPKSHKISSPRPPNCHSCVGWARQESW